MEAIKKKTAKLWTLSKLLKPPPPLGVVWTAKVWTLEDFLYPPPYPLGMFGHFRNKGLAFDKAFRLLRLETLC